MNLLDQTEALIFVSHGAPTFALETHSQAAENLIGLSESIQSAKAVIVLSPHFATRDLTINSGETPAIVHDFYGFPQALYELNYQAPGSFAYATNIAHELEKSGIPVTLDNTAKWDHGLWIPMRYLAPTGEKTIIQLSYPANWTPSQLEQLGAVLGELRRHGFAVVMSGGISHNFADLSGSHEQSAPYVERLRCALRQFATSHNQADFVEYVLHDSDFKRAHPTFEHFAPLFIAFFAAHKTDMVTWLDAPVAYHALAMDSILWASA